jgi:STE24 endopeptidase
VVKHELGHWHYSHPLQSIVFEIFNQGLLFWLFSFTINNHGILASFGFRQESNFVSFLIFLKLYDSFAWATNLFTNMISRHYEYQADQFAADEFRTALATGLIKVHVENAANLVPDPLFSALTFSHPELTERLAALGNPHLN